MSICHPLYLSAIPGFYFKESSIKSYMWTRSSKFIGKMFISFIFNVIVLYIQFLNREFNYLLEFFLNLVHRIKFVRIRKLKTSNNHNTDDDNYDIISCWNLKVYRYAEIRCSTHMMFLINQRKALCFLLTD